MEKVYRCWCQRDQRKKEFGIQNRGKKDTNFHMCKLREKGKHIHKGFHLTCGFKIFVVDS